MEYEKTFAVHIDFHAYVYLGKMKKKKKETEEKETIWEKRARKAIEKH